MSSNETKVSSKKNYCYFSYVSSTYIEPNLQKQLEILIHQLYSQKRCLEIPEKFPITSINPLINGLDIHFNNKEFVKEIIYDPNNFRWIPSIDNYL